MANSRKRISELPPLNVASLDTTFVLGISGSTTYKISINNLTSSLDGAFATDLVTNTLSTSLDSKLSTSSFQSFSSSVHQRILDATNEQSFNGLISGSSQFTSSYDERYVLSGSITQTTWDNIANKPNDIVSSSTQISDLGFITGSYTTINSFNSLTQSFNSISQSFTTISGSVGTIDFSGINAVTASYLSFTQSYTTDSSSFNNRITTEKNRIDAILSASNANGDTFAEVVALINSVDLTNDNAFATFYTASNGRLTSLENSTGSYLTSLSGAISSSEQVLDGSGVYSSSAQIQGNIYSAGSSFTFQDLLIGAGTTFGKITTDGSKYISVMPTYDVESARFWTNGNVTIQDGGDYVDNGFRLEVSGSTRIVGSFNATDGITGSTNFNTIVNKPTLISGSSQLTSSFDTRYTLSGSVQPLPSNLVSSSAQITAFGFISSSTTINTGSFVTTSSLNILSSSVDNRLDTLEATIISGSPNYTQILGDRRTNITTTGVSLISGSITTTGNPVQIMVTGDANPVNVVSWTRLQIYRNETAIGNIVQVENSSNLNVPYCLNVIDTPSAGTYSYSMRTVSGITGVFDFGESSGPTLTAVELRTNTSFQATATGIVNTNFIRYTRSSQQTSLSNGSVIVCNVLENSSGNVISPNTTTGQITLTAGKTYRLKGMVPGFTTSGINVRPQFCWYNETTAAYIGSSAQSYTPGDAAAFGVFGGTAEAVITPNVTTIVSFRLLNGASGLSAIGGNGDFSTTGSYPWIDIEDLTSTFALNTINTMQISGSLTTTGSMNSLGGITGSIASTNGVISGSSQLTSSYDIRYTLSGSVQPLPSGLISGSSQLTSSYDTRYTLSGSVVSGTTPAGTISGSSQLTSSLDGRYVQTGSFNTLTASFNSFTASAQSVTTGSNSFNGTQTITGSLIITTGSFVASQITANTASLYLTSGSNLYVQNNGIVEITGSMNVSGTTTFNDVVTFGASSGDEGAEIHLALAQTNNSLTGSVNIDVWRNRLRLWEGGGNARGVYVDLSKAPDGVGGELLYKASGFVDAGVDVTLGNLKARISTTGNRSLQLSTVSGTYSVYGSSVYSYNGVGAVTLNNGTPLSVTTTPAYLSPGYNFIVAGSTDTWNIMDTSAGIAWRITMIIGASYLNNFISIERL